MYKRLVDGMILKYPILGEEIKGRTISREECTDGRGELSNTPGTSALGPGGALPAGLQVYTSKEKKIGGIQNSEGLLLQNPTLCSSDMHERHCFLYSLICCVKVETHTWTFEHRLQELYLS